MAEEEYSEEYDGARETGEEIRESLTEAVEDDEIDPAEEGFVRGYQEERDDEWEE